MNISCIQHAKTRIVAGVTATALLSVVALGAPAQSAIPVASGDSASAAATTAPRPVLESDFGRATSRVQGTFGRNGTVTGTFTPRRFENSEGRLWAVGVLRATLTRGNGVEVGRTTEFGVRLPVRRIEGQPLNRVLQPQPSDCQILNLVLGPLDLNLLGLRVHLDRVVLNIFATPGPGNLLGNLLCAIAGLLDEDGVLREIRRILNAVLAILRL